MKRTNVVLDDALLAEAVRLSGERTYAATIHRALDEMVRRLKVRNGIQAFQGSGWWEGNLSEMRGDSVPTPTVDDIDWSTPLPTSMIADRPRESYGATKPTGDEPESKSDRRRRGPRSR